MNRDRLRAFVGHLRAIDAASAVAGTGQEPPLTQVDVEASAGEVADDVEDALSGLDKLDAIGRAFDAYVAKKARLPYASAAESELGVLLGVIADAFPDPPRLERDEAALLAFAKCEDDLSKRLGIKEPPGLWTYAGHPLHDVANRLRGKGLLALDRSDGNAFFWKPIP